jgi:hypothetical protein
MSNIVVMHRESHGMIGAMSVCSKHGTDEKA